VSIHTTWFLGYQHSPQIRDVGTDAKAKGAGNLVAQGNERSPTEAVPDPSEECRITNPTLPMAVESVSMEGGSGELASKWSDAPSAPVLLPATADIVGEHTGGNDRGIVSVSVYRYFLASWISSFAPSSEMLTPRLNGLEMF
jgi:hypothetical protein